MSSNSRSVEDAQERQHVRWDDPPLEHPRLFGGAVAHGQEYPQDLLNEEEVKFEDSGPDDAGQSQEW